MQTAASALQRSPQTAIYMLCVLITCLRAAQNAAFFFFLYKSSSLSSILFFPFFSFSLSTSRESFQAHTWSRAANGVVEMERNGVGIAFVLLCSSRFNFAVVLAIDLVVVFPASCFYLLNSNCRLQSRTALGLLFVFGIACVRAVPTFVACLLPHALRRPPSVCNDDCAVVA